MAAQRLGQQHVAKIFLTVLGDFRLLLRVTVVFERQYDRVVGRLERRLGDRFDHFSGRHLGHERVPVQDHRLVRLTVPQVQFDATAPGQQTLSVYLHRRLAGQLVTWSKTTNIR